ncbi:acyltransferase family protein [Pseudomonas quasicaspiana]|nr:acyltransferase family protein [Pseudomonas quasicaspiana]
MDARIARLKVVSCFLVILLHVSASQIVRIGDGWWAANIFDSLARVCVPAFLMISGALLLKKSEPLGEFLGKRFLRVFPPLLFWSLFYIAWIRYNGGDISNWFFDILRGPVMYHLWYLYAIIGLYALVPLLRRFYQGASFAEKMWVLALWFIVGSLWPASAAIMTPQACGNIGPTNSSLVYHLSSFGGYFGFFLLGAVLSDLRLSARLGASLFAGGALITMFMMYWHSSRVGSPCETFYGYQSPFVVIAAAGFFSFFLSFQRSAPSRMIALLADSTLGIYCLHILLIGGIFPMYGLVASGSNFWFMAPVISVAAFLLSWAGVFLMRLTVPGRWVT